MKREDFFDKYYWSLRGLKHNINDYKNKYLCEGKYLNSFNDFKEAFKPTKWSIRKYKEFSDSLDPEFRADFVLYTIVLLDENSKVINKEFRLFLEKIRIYYYYMGHRSKKEMNAKGYVIHNPIKIAKDHDHLLEILIDMHRSGYFECSLLQLKDQLVNCFDFGIPSTTLRDKIYRINKKRQINH